MKLAIGFITYGKATVKYLPYFLSSLKNQTFKDYEIIAVDNGEEENNPNKEFFMKNYPEIKLEWMGGNLGFAKANNIIIEKALASGFEYILFLNLDMILEPDAIEKMIVAIDKDKNLGSVCPKILKWDFNTSPQPSPSSGEGEIGKTNIIDSCGIIETSALRFSDLGQGEIDKGQYDRREILGPSGAAALYRMSALEKVKVGQEYFDELMFMYKEDCDLAYRLKLAGFKSKCLSDAVIFHDRTALGKGESDLEVLLNRKNKSRQVKSWSFLNQHVIFLRYWKLQNFWQKIEVLWYAFRMIAFAVLFERYLVGQYGVLWRMRKKL
jgi:GT2 family glycosyltransferase